MVNGSVKGGGRQDGWRLELNISPSTLAAHVLEDHFPGLYPQLGVSREDRWMEVNT